MSRNAVSFDVQALVSRVKQWLAEGKDVRVFATRPAVRGFPMIEMRDDRDVEVVTSATLRGSGATRALCAAATSSYRRDRV
jgi:hypothetical protein